MKDRIERFVVLPFSLGCVSHASVAVVEQRTRRSKDHRTSYPRDREEEEEGNLSNESLKNSSSRFLAVPKPNISTGVNRIVKGFKNLSQLFIYEDEMEELGMEMEIGCPTDVKHVTHIGWDGTTNTNPVMGWDNLVTPDLLSNHDSATAISLNQYGFSPSSPALTLDQIKLSPSTASVEHEWAESPAPESPESPPPSLAKASSGQLIKLASTIGRVQRNMIRENINRSMRP